MNTSLLRPAVLLLLVSCSSSRFYDHRFQPAPLEAEVATQAVSGAQVRALVTVLGIERAKDAVPHRALVRMRLENLGTAPAKLDVDSLSLVSADLKAFGPASASAGECGEIPAGGNAVCDFGFPMPEGKKPHELDLSGLNLRFSILFGEHKETVGATFHRTDWRYYEPGNPRVHIGVGYGWRS